MAQQRLVIGLTGYPNVGKSSTINALFGSKKTAVAATPGKTKHFQVALSTQETARPGVHESAAYCMSIARLYLTGGLQHLMLGTHRFVCLRRYPVAA